jgi:hypothetical protein
MKKHKIQNLSQKIAGPPLKCGRLPIPFVNGDCKNSHVRDDSLETDGIAAA